MNRKEGSVRKNEILDKSLALFVEKGYEKTTVENILEKVGIKKGTLYYYFESKEEILEALAWREAEKKLEITKTAADDSLMNAAEKINRIISEAQKINFSGLETRTELLSTVSETENCRLYQRLYDCSLSIGMPYLERIVRQGVEEGIFRTEYPEEAALFYVEMMNGLKRSFGSMLMEMKDWEEFKGIFRRKILFYQDMLENMFQCNRGIIRFADISLKYLNKIFPEVMI